MMNLKKLILFCFMLTMCYSNVFAAEITCGIENNHLVISGDFGEEYAYRMIALQMNGPFEAYTEFPDTVEDVGNDFKKNEKTEFITVYLDENGEFNYSFYPKVGNRFYAVAAYASGFEKPWSETILNVDDGLEGTVVALLNAAQTSSEIKGIFNNEEYYNILTYYYPVFRNIKSEDNKELVYKVLFECKEDENFTDLKGSYGDAIIPISVVMNINEMSEEQAKDALIIAEGNFDFKNVPLYDIYKDMTQAEQQNVFKRLIGVRHCGVSEFMSSFDTAVFLQMIESENFKNNLTTLLNKYATTYKVNINGYNSNVDVVNDAIYSKYFKTTEELSGAIAAAISSDVIEEPSAGSGGGSGSGRVNNVYISSPTSPDKIMLPETRIFDDLDSVAWAKEAIETLYERGVINGLGGKIFAPNANVKREEFVKMILLATGEHQTGDVVGFIDVTEDAWYYSYIASAVQLGWIKGISETSFGIGAPLTRQDMAVLIERATRIQAEISQQQFSDDSLISDYAKDAVYRLRSAGIINGDEGNRFNPKAYATRAEVAKVLYEIMKEGR